MHYSAKHGLAIACRLSVHLSLCDVDRSWPHRLKILKTNCANSWPNIFALHSPKVIHLLPGEHGKIFGRKCSFNTYIHNVQLNWVNRESRDLKSRCGCWFTLCWHIAQSSLQWHSFLVTLLINVLFNTQNFQKLLTSHVFLADRTIGRAYGTVCRLSVCRLSVVCLWRFVLWQNGAS